MKLVSSETMRALDAYCIDDLSIPGLRLMESAGTGTVRFIEQRLGPQAGKTVTIVCGKGNNGGDGFVIARELRARGAVVETYLAGHRDDVLGDARANMERLGPGGVVELADGRSVGSLAAATMKSDLIVDAVFGTGFKGAPMGLSGTVIGQMNACGRPVLAVDVPSGLNASTGAAEGECVRATWTCAMGFPKRGFYISPGRELVGEVHVVDIGVPHKAVEAVGVHDNVLTPRDAAGLLPPRPHDANKGTFGRIVVIAGSVGYTGAAALASLSALRSGAGLVVLGVPESLNDIMEAKLTEVITRPLPETANRVLSRAALPAVRELLESADAAAIGPGLSRDPETQALVQAVIEGITIPCVVDADGLNALTVDRVKGRTGGAPMVLTPHPGEMARLTGRAVAEVQSKRDDVARDVAARAAATVVLKGAGTVVADPSGEVYLNPTGGSGLATAGTGDVLTGVIAALLGQRVAATHAAALGAFVHGRAGDLAAAAKGRVGMIAGDVTEHLPDVFVELEKAR
jgi:NAD(P)H-hydrate epimerase